MWGWLFLVVYQKPILVYLSNMNRLVALFTGLLMAGSVLGQDVQRAFHGGLTLGLSTTQIDGDGYGGFNKAGILFGGYVNSKLSDKVTGEFQLTYIQKGSINPQNPSKGDFDYYRIRLSYVEVPLIFRMKKGKFFYGIGPSLGVLINSSEEDQNGEVNLPFHSFKSTEVGLNFDLIYDLTKRIQTNIRYTHSMLPISNETKFTRWGLIGGSYSMSLNFALRLRLSKD